MRCRECAAADQESRVYVNRSERHAMAWQPYYDEDGSYHSHDPNTVATEYTCSNGHTFVITGKVPCPAQGCNYGRPE